MHRIVQRISDLRWTKVIRTYVTRHKIISATALIIVLFAGYKGYGALIDETGSVRYVVTPAEKTTLIVSVSGSGQVSVRDQVDVKSKASGDLVYVGVKNGDEVKAGTLLAQLDMSNARQTVEDAEISLAQAKLNLEKMKGLTNDEGSIRGTKEKAANDLEEAYENGFNTVTSAFLDLPDVMSNFYSILYGTTLGVSGQWNIDYYPNAILDALKTYSTEYYTAIRFRNDVADSYEIAKTAFDKTFSDYKSASRFSDTETIENLIAETYDTTKLIAEAIKDTNNLIQFYKDQITLANIQVNTTANTHLSQLATYTASVNSLLSSMLSKITAIQTSKENIVTSSFDIADQEIKVRQAERALAETQETLKDYYVWAPFSGIVAEVNVKKGESVSNGNTVATMITREQIAELTLNELDAAKVEIGQKAVLTFDAFPDLEIAGKIASVDTIGAVSQGVVTYTVDITFDTQESGVKPGMSVSAVIITDVRQNVIVVSSGAVKTGNGISYVEMFDALPEGANAQGFASDVLPSKREVEVGLSNDTESEIISGLEEGMYVVTRTVSGSANSVQTNTARSLFGGGGGIPR